MMSSNSELLSSRNLIVDRYVGIKNYLNSCYLRVINREQKCKLSISLKYKNTIHFSPLKICYVFEKKYK